MSTFVVGLINVRQNRAVFFTLYLFLISTGGLLLFGWSLWQVPAYEAKLPFWLFVGFATLVALLTTSMSIPNGSAITYHVGSAVSIATAPLFGPSAAMIVAAVQCLCTWLVKPAHAQTWRKSWRQLSFNIGMDVLAILAAALVLLFLREQLIGYPLLRITAPWISAALIYNEVNLWLLIGVLWLQQGRALNPLAVWREEHWATQIDVILMAIGGALLSFAATHYDWLGIVMFFLPIGLSAYAFRLYVQQMQAHLDNLDQIVNERTASLQSALAQLQVEMHERQRIEAELRRLATFDPLTNAMNRRSFFEGAHAEFRQAQPVAAQLAVLMFDLDRFKQINDRYGHAAGDLALKYFAGLVEQVVPEAHLFGRLGGEEFALLLPSADRATALAIGERIRYHCPNTPLSAGGATFTLTVSVGAAALAPIHQTLDQVLEEADQQLYAAKRQGGNCVMSDGQAVMVC